MREDSPGRRWRCAACAPLTNVDPSSSDKMVISPTTFKVIARNRSLRRSCSVPTLSQLQLTHYARRQLARPDLLRQMRHRARGEQPLVRDHLRRDRWRRGHGPGQLRLGRLKSVRSPAQVRAPRCPPSLTRSLARHELVRSVELRASRRVARACTQPEAEG